MIRNVVIHLSGKLPIVADLRAAPAAADQAVVCTNVRTRDGKRPSFIDDGAAWFVIPMHEVTIIELPATAFDLTASDAPIPLGAGSAESDGPARLAAGESGDGDAEIGALEANEDLLARIRGL